MALSTLNLAGRLAAEALTASLGAMTTYPGVLYFGDIAGALQPGVTAELDMISGELTILLWDADGNIIARGRLDWAHETGEGVR